MRTMKRKRQVWLPSSSVPLLVRLGLARLDGRTTRASDGTPIGDDLYIEHAIEALTNLIEHSSRSGLAKRLRSIDVRKWPPATARAIDVLPGAFATLRGFAHGHWPPGRLLALILKDKALVAQAQTL